MLEVDIQIPISPDNSKISETIKLDENLSLIQIKKKKNRKFIFIKKNSK